ncbi:MAG: hypothetical protein GF416_05270 [Candidatus Altiarchaeales archaeon]|nr:hypothetical protein [Candidatus Altiarchaeales archaeon]MBD3416527.1 hypothetical protein [Candidatus Altiarchaeales archaeon]
MRRGFVVSLDVMAATIIAVVMIVATLTLLTEPSKYPDEYLYRYSVDFLTVATKEGSFSDGISGNWTPAEDLFDMASSNVCFNVTLKDQDESLVYNYTRPCRSPDYAVVGKYVVTDGGRNYLSEMRMWYK